MDELYQQIINIYKETGSVKKTAEELGTYPNQSTKSTDYGGIVAQ